VSKPKKWIGLEIRTEYVDWLEAELEVYKWDSLEAALNRIAELETENAKRTAYAKELWLERNKLREAIEIHRRNFTTHKEAACTTEDRELWAALENDDD
jgi:hypothetical protein